MNRSNKHIDLLRIIALFIVVIGIVYFHINLFIPSILPFFLKLGVFDRPLNILVLGTDITFNTEFNYKVVDKGRSDSIILLRFDPLLSKVNMVSIPRDTYAEIPGYGYSKINAAFVYGGIDLTKATVEKLTGVRIDRFLIINTKGIVKLVDIVGGVWIDVDRDMYYVDRAGGLFVDLKKGRHKLSGKEAEGYVRFRHDDKSDYGRMGRQQEFLKSLTSRLANPFSLLRAPFIIEIIRNNIRSNFSLKEFMMLANTARTMSIKKINTVTLPGVDANNEAGSVVIIDRAEMQKIIKEYF